MATSGRRLTLSPIGFDIVLALSQAPDGLRLAELSHIIGSPVSSVQTALRVLIANRLVSRPSVEPPRYALADDHPARDELASLATVLPESAHAIAVILRANPVITYAAVDKIGFLASERRSANAPASQALDKHLALVAQARPESPDVMRMSEEEFKRILRVSMGLRSRAAKAVTLKGRAPAAPGDTVERPRSAIG